MKFKIKELKNLLSLITKHDITNIGIKSQYFNLTINTIKNEKTLKQNNIISNQINNYNPISHLTSKQKTKNTNKHQNQEIDTYFTIISPMIGTFYRSPAPNEEPFIQINNKVHVNQTVCIIEAMKLMNEIESEVNGRIVEILVQDGDIVDCGQPLMKVKHE